jgi:hypothetical protein
MGIAFQEGESLVRTGLRRLPSERISSQALASDCGGPLSLAFPGNLTPVMKEMGATAVSTTWFRF